MLLNNYKREILEIIYADIHALILLRASNQILSIVFSVAQKFIYDKPITNNDELIYFANVLESFAIGLQSKG